MGVARMLTETVRKAIIETNTVLHRHKLSGIAHSPTEMTGMFLTKLRTNMLACPAKGMVQPDEWRVIEMALLNTNSWAGVGVYSSYAKNKTNINQVFGTGYTCVDDFIRIVKDANVGIEADIEVADSFVNIEALLVRMDNVIEETREIVRASHPTAEGIVNVIEERACIEAGEFVS